MDPRKAVTRKEYQIERTAIVAMFLDLRTGRHGDRTEMYLYGARAAAKHIRRAYFARGNARNRVAA